MVSFGRAATRSGGLSRNVRVDDLARSLRTELRHRVTELAVHAADEEGLTVTGRSRTYYGKQLATHALLAAAPGVPLRNEIVVG
ncbi:MAG TPA: hypothetical protein VF170_10895 [Planctomycetaceae bacterium]